MSSYLVVISGMIHFNCICCKCGWQLSRKTCEDFHFLWKCSAQERQRRWSFGSKCRQLTTRTAALITRHLSLAAFGRILTQLCFSTLHCSSLFYSSRHGQIATWSHFQVAFGASGSTKFGRSSVAIARCVSPWREALRADWYSGNHHSRSIEKTTSRLRSTCFDNLFQEIGLPGRWTRFWTQQSAKGPRRWCWNTGRRRVLQLPLPKTWTSSFIRG